MSYLPIVIEQCEAGLEQIGASMKNIAGNGRYQNVPNSQEAAVVGE
jgi:hypothetical protein